MKDGRSSPSPFKSAYTRKIQERNFILNNQNTSSENFRFLFLANKEKFDHIHMFVNNNNNYYYYNYYY